jgi:competence protein ComEA
MLKKLLALMLSLMAAAAFAAVDVNKATQAELDGIKGIGPSIAGKILDERKKAPFKDWADFVDRVKGVGDGNAAKFSAEGLTVNGATFKGAAAPAPAKTEAPAAKKDDKPAAAPAAAPAAKKEAATAAAPAATPAPMSAADKKAAAKKEKEEKKAAAEAAKKEKAEKAAAAKKEKAEKAAAKKDDKPAAAAAAPAAASAAKK